MSSNLQPIKLWGSAGANPPKVAMILRTLGLPYETVPLTFADVKKPEYLAVNTNGRMPDIYDPNADLTPWESGAIVEYIVERYDTERKISFEPGSPEYYHARQWAMFQASGQGPYYGQPVWFNKLHHERLPSAVERYLKEIKRVTGVFESYLKKQKEKKNGDNGPWLVGGKMSYADISFVCWQNFFRKIAFNKEQFDEDEFPEVQGWMNRMRETEAVDYVIKTAFKVAS